MLKDSFYEFMSNFKCLYVQLFKYINNVTVEASLNSIE